MILVQYQACVPPGVPNSMVYRLTVSSCGHPSSLIRVFRERAVAPSGRLEVEGSRVRDLPVSLRCVLELDTLSSA